VTFQTGVVLIWLVCVTSLSDILTRSKIGGLVRNRVPMVDDESSRSRPVIWLLGHLLRCPKCAGFWIAGGLGGLGFYIVPDFMAAHWAVVVINMLVGYGCCRLADACLHPLEKDQ